MIAADILIFAVIAAGLVLWLRNILGTRHGEESERQNPFQNAEDKVKATREAAQVIHLDENGAITEPQLEDLLPVNVTADSDAVREGLAAIARADRTFSVKEFMTKVQDAFALIIESFADGDKDMLKSLLAKPVYTSFEAAIKEREKAGERVDTEVHAIRHVDVLDAALKGNMAFITLRFTAEESCVVSDSEGNTLSGHPDQVTEMTDVWTFGRDIRGRDPVWRVYETRDDAAEAHKTPLPDAGEV